MYIRDRITELEAISIQGARYFLIRLGKIGELEHEEISSVLNCEDLQRARRFVFEKERDRSLLVYTAAKSILGDILGVMPGSLSFFRNAFGKPFLSGYPLQFNLSHAGDYALLGYHPERSIGVDIEKVDRTIAQDAFLHSSEKKWLLCASKERLFKVWSAKEAYVKALGIGFSQSMPLLEVMCTDSHEGVECFRAHLSGNFSSLAVRVYDTILSGYTIATCLTVKGVCHAASRTLE